jgi:hypothetical protein
MTCIFFLNMNIAWNYDDLLVSEVYSKQHYVIKFVSDLVGGFLRFPPPIKLTATI